MGGLGLSREAEAGFPDQAGPSRSINVESVWSAELNLLIARLDGG